MFYHASPIVDLKELEPKVSKYHIPLIYSSDKREHVLIDLSNAIEKHCKEMNFQHKGKYTKWASYGFIDEGKLQIEEYYPNALIETYKGVSGYIYHCSNLEVKVDFDVKIPHTFVTDKPIKVNGYEYISDAYEAIMTAEKQGLIEIKNYDDFMSEKKKDWLISMIKEQFKTNLNQPDYRFF